MLALSQRLNNFVTVALHSDRRSALVCPRRYKTYLVYTTIQRSRCGWCEYTNTAATAHHRVSKPASMPWSSNRKQFVARPEKTPGCSRFEISEVKLSAGPSMQLLVQPFPGDHHKLLIYGPPERYVGAPTPTVWCDSVPQALSQRARQKRHPAIHICLPVVSSVCPQRLYTTVLVTYDINNGHVVVLFFFIDR